DYADLLSLPSFPTRRSSDLGTLQAGKLADLVILSGDYFSMPVDEVKNLESELTMVGGKVVYGAGPYASQDAPSLPSLPDWLPLRSEEHTSELQSRRELVCRL